MFQGEAVRLFPVVADEGRDKQQKSALRLVEVGDERLGEHDRAGGRNHQSSGGMQGVEMMQIQIF